VGDQYYLLGWSRHDLRKIEFASSLFPLNRSIALGPAYFYLAKNEPSDKSLHYINAGLIYDPNAVDLLKAKITHSLMLGKQKDATEAYNRLSILAPKR
jgi:hypothetical protein